MKVESISREDFWRVEKQYLQLIRIIMMGRSGETDWKAIGAGVEEETLP